MFKKNTRNVVFDDYIVFPEKSIVKAQILNDSILLTS
jgi:hypothetical protein